MKIYLVGASLSLLLLAQAAIAHADPVLATEVVVCEEEPLFDKWHLSSDLVTLPEVVRVEFDVNVEERPRPHGRRKWRDRHTGVRYQVRGLLNSKRPSYLRQKVPRPY